MPGPRRFLLPVLAVCILSMSFWYSDAWLRLASGIALFLFGMQCLEEGLKQLAGSKLEQWLERSTATRLKSFLFGVAGTMVLQSTTLMSMLTIAFISTGMIRPGRRYRDHSGGQSWHQWRHVAAGHGRAEYQPESAGHAVAGIWRTGTLCR